MHRKIKTRFRNLHENKVNGNRNRLLPERKPNPVFRFGGGAGDIDSEAPTLAVYRSRENVYVM